MLNSQRCRRPDRLKLFYVVLDLLSDRTFFSARQLAQAIYYGRVPFRQQLKYVQERIDEAVANGDMIRDDTIAACPLYRASVRRPRGSTGLVFTVMLKAYPGEWHQDQLLGLYSLMDDLDRFVPYQPDINEYDRRGRLPVPSPMPDPDRP